MRCSGLSLFLDYVIILPAREKSLSDGGVDVAVAAKYFSTTLKSLGKDVLLICQYSSGSVLMSTRGWSKKIFCSVGMVLLNSVCEADASKP
jgi:hypothetical protein